MSVLDNFLKSKRIEVSNLKLKRRRLLKAESFDEVNELDREIEDLEATLRRFLKSKMEPAKVGNIVINNKMLERFMKKLNDMKYKTTVSDKSLLIEFGKWPGEWSGSLELFDISSHFEGCGDITKEVNYEL